jgi:23S rRNA (guanine745-N1)-methyltransferase
VDVDRLASWLRCPVCGDDLESVPPLVLRCARGHAVDANKRGYVSLLGPGTRVVGDTADMLAARGRFLDRGHYGPVVEALLETLGGPRLDLPALRVLDAGCGTGHYLRAVLDHLPGSSGLAADLSPAAVAIAVRGRTDVDGVVADTWASLPMRDGAVDLVLDVFAPRNLAEFHRVLARGGRVVVVAAGPGHLAELRAAGRAVGVQEDKRERILDAAAPLFEAISETRVQRVLHLSDDDVALLLGMGPSAHHTAARQGDLEPGASAERSIETASVQQVSIDVMIHVLRRRDVTATG